MQTYDLFMVVVLIAATVWGLWKGLAWQLASLGSTFLSYFIAYQFRYAVAEHINTEPPWNVFLAMLILYLATSALVWIAFRAVRAFIDQVKLKEFDHQIGAILGAAKGVILCVIITLFAVTLASEPQRQSIIGSRSGFYIAHLLDKSHGIMPVELHDILEPYLHSLDDSLDGGITGIPVRHNKYRDRACRDPGYGDRDRGFVEPGRLPASLLRRLHGGLSRPVIVLNSSSFCIPCNLFAQPDEAERLAQYGIKNQTRLLPGGCFPRIKPTLNRT